MESLQDVRRHARPEHESRIDSMSRDLEDLRLDVQNLPANPHATFPVAFKEADVRRFRSRLATIIEAEDSFFADKIAASLNYDSRPVRHDSVPQAHKETFQWAFDSRLSEWFPLGSGTFWISGKPGSGKSTFMKFISRHPQTKELLDRLGRLGRQARSCGPFLLDRGHADPEVVAGAAPVPALRRIAQASLRRPAHQSQSLGGRQVRAVADGRGTVVDYRAFGSAPSAGINWQYAPQDVLLHRRARRVRQRPCRALQGSS